MLSTARKSIFIRLVTEGQPKGACGVFRGFLIKPATTEVAINYPGAFPGRWFVEPGSQVAPVELHCHHSATVGGLSVARERGRELLKCCLASPRWGVTRQWSAVDRGGDVCDGNGLGVCSCGELWR